MNQPFSITFVGPNPNSHLRFHPIHSRNIKLSEDRKTATRSNVRQPNGLTFSDRPVHPEELVLIKFLGTSNGIRGSIRFGFTCCDPIMFENDFPGQSSTMDPSRTWINGLEESLYWPNKILHYYFTPARSVHYGMNGVDRGILHIPFSISQQQLWAVVDVSGNCTSIEIMDRSAEMYLALPTSNNAASVPFRSSRIYKSSRRAHHVQNEEMNNSEQKNECIICCDNSINSAVYKCGHMCMCYKCAETLKREKGFCPICRATIKDVIRTYKS